MDDNNANDDDYDNDDNAMNLELHHHLYRGSEATYDTLVHNNEIMAFMMKKKMMMTMIMTMIA